MITAAQKRLWLPAWARAPLLFAKHPVRGPTGKPLTILDDEENLKPAFAEDGNECNCCGIPCCDRPTIGVGFSGMTCVMSGLNGPYSLSRIGSCSWQYTEAGTFAGFFTPSAPFACSGSATLRVSANHDGTQWNASITVDRAGVSGAGWLYDFDPSECDGSHVSTNTAVYELGEICREDGLADCVNADTGETGVGGSATISA